MDTLHHAESQGGVVCKDRKCMQSVNQDNQFYMLGRLFRTSLSKISRLFSNILHHLISLT